MTAPQLANSASSSTVSVAHAAMMIAEDFGCNQPMSAASLQEAGDVDDDQFWAGVSQLVPGFLRPEFGVICKNDDCHSPLWLSAEITQAFQDEGRVSVELRCSVCLESYRYHRDDVLVQFRLGPDGIARHTAASMRKSRGGSTLPRR